MKRTTLVVALLISACALGTATMWLGRGSEPQTTSFVQTNYAKERSLTKERIQGCQRQAEVVTKGALLSLDYWNASVVCLLDLFERTHPAGVPAVQEALRAALTERANLLAQLPSGKVPEKLLTPENRRRLLKAYPDAFSLSLSDDAREAALTAAQAQIQKPALEPQVPEMTYRKPTNQELTQVPELLRAEVKGKEPTN